MSGMNQTITQKKDFVSDGQQIGIGLFQLFQGGLQVGRLLVQHVGELMEEHWDLWQTFRQPSWVNVRQDLMFEYVGEPIGLEDYRSTIRPQSTYIIASCRTVSGSNN
ncbi:MAG: hypothetical protein IPK82_17810 [Polyangiaceae bacterium]|nr:hypothetical protein [Polyangiaceae bacterium]